MPFMLSSMYTHTHPNLRVMTPSGVEGKEMGWGQVGAQRRFQFYL